MRRPLIAAASLLACLTSACAQIASKDVKTEAIQATFSMLSNGTGITQVTGTMVVGYDQVKESSGDELTVTDGHDKIVMGERDNIIGATSFIANVSTDTPGTLLTVAFKRTDNVSAPTSTVVLPSKFTLGFNNTGTTFSRGKADLTIPWDTTAGSGESMSWAASGECISSGGGAIPSGSLSLTLPRGTLVSAGGSAPTSCAVTITITRLSTGTIDSAFAKGSGISATQARTVTVQSVL